MKRVEIAGYVVIAAALVFATVAAAWTLFVAEDPAHHFDSGTAPFTISFSFLFLLLVVADVLGLLWLIRRIRGRH